MSRRLELAALAGLAFFLPLYEAPKSIFWILYVIVWVANRARSRDLGERWDGWDTLIAAWMVSGFVVAPFAAISGGNEWRGSVDILRCGSVLLLVKRARYEWREVRWVLGGLVVSGVVGTVWALAYWVMRGSNLQLNSVGHVNQTAIYLGIMLMLCASWALATRHVLAVGAAAFMLLAVFLAASRAALIVALPAVVVLALAFALRSWRASVAAIAVVVASLGVTWIGGTEVEVMRKQEMASEQQDVLQRRDAVWHLALVAFRQHPWAGVGVDNYGLIRYPQYRDWSIAQGGSGERGRFAQFGHGHSLYLNTLAERGMVGALVVLALLVAWLASLLRRWPRRAAPDADWLLWGAAAGAWMITAGVGLANTTLHHEHGLLAALLLGLWLTKRPAP